MRFQPGESIGDYKVLALLGKGGAGRVYKVSHKVTGRVEALKILLPDAAGDSDQAQRFVREIQVQAALSHPHIAAVYNAFYHEGQLVMVSEFVDGESLQDILAGEGIELSESLRIAAEALAGLDHAHRHGVVHRDVKPANLLLTAERQVKVADFGLAKRDRDVRLTDTGAPMGSFLYAAPEQIQGQADARSDIYALGATLYHLCTGQAPFRGKDLLALMNAHVSQAPQPPAQVAAHIPPRLESAILRALEKDPERRFSSAADFYYEIDAIRQDLAAPVSSAAEAGANPAGATWRIPRWPLWTAVALLLVATAIGLVWWGSGSSTEHESAGLQLPAQAPEQTSAPADLEPIPDSDPPPPAIETAESPPEPSPAVEARAPTTKIDRKQATSSRPPAIKTSSPVAEAKPSPSRTVAPATKTAGRPASPRVAPPATSQQRPSPPRSLPEKITVALASRVDSDNGPQSFEARIVVPSAWSGATVLGHVLEAESSGEPRERSRVRLEFYALVDERGARPIESRMSGFRNAAGRPEIDDGRYSLGHDNEWHKRAAGPTFRGRVGGDGRIRVRTTVISGRAPRIRFGPGSEFDLRVRESN